MPAGSVQDFPSSEILFCSIGLRTPKNPTCVKSHFSQGENAILRLEIQPAAAAIDVARPQDASSAAELGAAQGSGGVPLRALRLQVGRRCDAGWVNSLLLFGWPCLGKNGWHPKIYSETYIPTIVHPGDKL